MHSVTLNDAEQKLAMYLAKTREQFNKETNATNCRRSPKSDYEIHLEGAAAEIAFCKMHNIYPDTDNDTRHAADAMTHDGRAIDVKYSGLHYGSLLVLPWKVHNKSDLYALMVGKFPTYRFAGIATADEIFKKENIKDYGHGPTYSVDQDQLHADLIEQIGLLYTHEDNDDGSF